MNDDQPQQTPVSPPRPEPTLWSSSVYRLCEEVITLRETTKRQHRLFEQSLLKAGDAIQTSFNSFAADTQRAYQQLRQELHGEKRVSLALLNELLELALDMERIAASWPSQAEADGVGPATNDFSRWADAVQVQTRKVQAALQRHGIHPYDAVVGAAYNPALHERVGGKTIDGMGPLLVAEQVEHGWASQQPEFVLRRPKVLVSE